MTGVPIRRIREAAEARADELVEALVSFVRVASENPPGALLAEARAWIEDRLDGYGIPCATHPTSRTEGDHAILVGSFGEAGGPHVVLHGHYDVVPAFHPDQFVPEVRDGNVYGRGACDMKGGLVSMLVAATIHRELGGAGEVRLVYVPDEESGGSEGSERMAELGLLEPATCRGAIVGEPSHPEIWHAARGALTVEIAVRGRPAHVGLHYEGANAFERGHEVVSRLLEWRDDVTRRRTSFDIQPEAARASIVLLGGVSGGGTNFNIVPDEFRFTVDRRPNPDEPWEEARRELLDLLGELRAEHDLSFEILQDAPSTATSLQDDLARSVQESVARATDREAPLTLCPGCLETRIYTAAGISAVAYGPGPIEAMHAPDEHVPVANLVESCAVYAAVLGDLLGYDA